MPKSLKAWRNMEHLPQKLHPSIHNYADSGVIHNLSLSHFSRQSNLTKNTVLTAYKQNIITLIILTKAHLVWILTDSAKILLN